MKSTIYYCVEGPGFQGGRGAVYGCSRRLEEAVMVLERGRKRGVTWAKITEHKSRPSRQPAGWLSPFADYKAGF